MVVGDDIGPLSTITIGVALLSLCLGILAYARLLHAPETVTGNGLAATSICISGCWLLLYAGLLWFYR
jgi:hypothetical protein